ncbi:L-seryl-tRNA(Sec) selenium transferase [Laribacter hongkongensis]|uniref:L-seryl-tRNA(Sec) selenium transferase n=1 Tax=Laribacter hongkongensis TaxID=168471 RepID=UPI001EFCA245|nr:L-seryl-tRNA(Sec) selenium transferase [Laribacter hongkongensis]MCG9079948.1 L-seryl-tRNA(Sec) selenium transferase [Laribacter hongkongensis]
MPHTHSLLSRLPGLDALLRLPATRHLITRHGRHAVSEAARAELEQLRAHVRQHAGWPQWFAGIDSLPPRLEAHCRRRQQPALRPVFNLTGTILHTNLGRAIQADAAIDAVRAVMRGAVTLEYDLDGAGRGHRDHAVSELLAELTGAEAACVVNNNAAAVLILLSTVATGREVIVSRGELVEIGGAFRMPDVMRQAGCRLVEVGATNRTHLRDYRDAIGPDTALLMKVHTSNYSIEGFSSSVPEADLVPLARQHGLPVATDLGSGALVDLAAWGLPAEPMPRDMLAAGLDLVSFSGDKLLGGPQAGLIVGRQEWIDRLQKHPLKRALRCDKLTLAALEATLRLYLEPDRLTDTLPTLRLLTRPQADIRQLAERLAGWLAAQLGPRWQVQAEACLSQIGSGSLPVDRLPSHAVTLAPADGRGKTLEQLATALRELEQPVIGRLKDGRLWLDLRSLEDEAAFRINLLPLLEHYTPEQPPC